MPRETKAAKSARAVEVCRRLDQKYGPVECFLDHESPFHLVISVLLSAQTTDAQVNRVTAWIVGLRAAGKALLAALLEPTALMREAEYAGNLGKRMAMLDECKNLPLNAVWDYLCWKKNAGVGMSWLDEMDRYEREVQRKRV